MLDTKTPSAPAPDASNPATLLLLLVVPYLLWNGLAASVLFVIALDEIYTALVVWAIIGISLGFPFCAVLSWAGSRAEVRLHDQPPPQPLLWLPLAWGITLGAHWLPACFWSVLLVGAAVLEPARADDHLWGALLALVAWVVVGIGVAAVVVARQALDRRSWRGRKPTPPSRQTVPASIVMAGGYTLSCAAAGLVLVGWLSTDGWSGGGGVSAIFAWLAAGVGVAIVAGGAQGVWHRASAPYVSGSSPGVSTVGEEAMVPQQMEVAGALFAAHWIPLYLLALAPNVISIEDLRWLVLIAAFAAILSGTALWSVARVVVRTPVTE